MLGRLVAGVLFLQASAGVHCFVRGLTFVRKYEKSPVLL